MKELIDRYQNQIRQLALTHEEDIRKLKSQHEKELQNLREKLEQEKSAMAGGYEVRIKELEQKLAAEIRKMEDSNGYLKKMYEEKINNYEKEIA